MATDSSADRVFRVLLICTGNICRSALGERLGRAFLAETLGPDAELLLVESAGVQAVVGSAMHPDTALVLQGLGGDPEGFVSRQFEPEMAASADLVLTMTRAQRRTVLERAPKALSRTFTLREAASLLERSAGPPPAGGLSERATALVGLLGTARSGRHGTPADDVPDPMGRPVEVHQQAGELIAANLLPLLATLAGRRNGDPETVTAA